MPASALSRLEDHLGFWMRCASNRVSGAFAERLERHGVTPAQWVALRVLHDRPACTLQELAAAVGVDEGATSRMAVRLARRGWLGRAAVPGDRRAVHLSLTEAGRRLVPKLAREADRNDAAFFGVLSHADRKTLLRLVRSVLEKNGWTGAPALS